MQQFDTDKIIGAGLLLALFLYLIIMALIYLFTATLLPIDFATNIVAGLTGYMARSSHTEK